MRLTKDRLARVVDASFGAEMLEASDRAQAGNPESEQVWLLLLDEIDPDPDQPRRHFDPAALQDLADDIERRGVLQPILVRPVEGRYRIIVGERRWRAARLAGKSRIPCLIRDTLSSQEVREAQLVENVIRQGISDVERGVALRNLYSALKERDPEVTWETVAAKVGLTRMRVHQLQQLSALPAPVIEMIQTRRLSGSHAQELLRLLDDPDTLLTLAEGACRPLGSGGSYGCTVPQLRARVQEAVAARLSGRDGVKSTLHEPLSAPVRRLLSKSRDVVAGLSDDLPPEARESLRRDAEAVLAFLNGQGASGPLVGPRHGRDGAQAPPDGLNRIEPGRTEPEQVKPQRGRNR